MAIRILLNIEKMLNGEIMKEFLNHYSEVAVGLEKMSDYVQRLHKAMKAAQAESKEGRKMK